LYFFFVLPHPPIDRPCPSNVPLTDEQVILAGVPCLYVDRPGWAEHETLARALHHHTTTAPVDMAEVLAASDSLFVLAGDLCVQHGRGSGVQHQAADSTAGPKPLGRDGAQRVAATLLDLAR